MNERTCGGKEEGGRDKVKVDFADLNTEEGRGGVKWDRTIAYAQWKHKRAMKLDKHKERHCDLVDLRGPELALSSWKKQHRGKSIEPSIAE